MGFTISIWTVIRIRLICPEKMFHSQHPLKLKEVSPYPRTIDFECCRCLKPIKEHISGDIAVLYERTDRVIPETEDLTAADDIEVLDYHTKAIDLSHRIEEVIQLSIPLKPMCSEDCKGLCLICGINLNENTCDCELEKDDPRWHVLKTLLKEE